MLDDVEYSCISNGCLSDLGTIPCPKCYDGSIYLGVGNKGKCNLCSYEYDVKEDGVKNG